MQEHEVKRQKGWPAVSRYIMPGKQIQALELQKLELVLEDLKNQGEASDIRTRCIRGCENLIRQAKVAWDARVRFLPWMKFSNDDYVFGVIRAVRIELMKIIGISDFTAFVAECYAELSYVEGTEQTELRTQLKQLSDGLNATHGGGEAGLSEDLRRKLISIATRLDQARTVFWWKVNDYKIRMLIFAVTLFVVLAGAIFFMSLHLSEGWWFFLIIALLGALGGLLGGLLRSEDVNAHLGAFFLNRVHALLSPILGACGALAIYFLLKSGIVALPPKGEMDNGVPYYVYAIAFFSGFSERLLLMLLEQGTRKFEPPGRKDKHKHQE